MKKTGLIIGACALVITIATIACNSNESQSKNNEGVNEPVAISQDSLISRGDYLVTIMGCDDCHTPKKMGPMGPELDMSKRLSGHPEKMPIGSINQDALKSWVLFNHTTTAMVGPWGISFAANLTSDESGIGNWTEQQFFTSLRKGKAKGLENGRALLPPMPWPNYAKASDEDLRAVFAFLKNTQPVYNVVPAPRPPDALSKLN